MYWEPIVSSTVVSLLTQLPVYLVWLTGVVLALVFWRRQRTAAMLMLAALAIQIVSLTIRTLLSSSLPLMIQRGVSPSQFGFVLTAQNLFFTLVSAVAWGLVLWAVFGVRQKAQA